MAQPRIEISINGQSCHVVTCPILVADAVNYVEIKAEFDSTWNGLNKTYYFTNKDITIKVESNDEIIKIPHEVMIPGCCFVGIKGVKLNTEGTVVDVQATSHPLELKIRPSKINEDADNHVDPTPTDIEQIRAIAEEAMKMQMKIDKHKIEDYLYDITYDYIDYDFAYEYFKSHNVNVPAACSSVRKGNFYGRNLDWVYNEQVDFIVHIPRIAGRYASIGVGSGTAGLTKEIVESGAYNDLYKIIPFITLDGINEYGVFMNTNVVPQDKGETTGTIPEGEQEVEIASLMLPRYVLDHFTSATEAVNYIREHVSIYATGSLKQMGYESHFMLGDSEKTYLLETRNNVLYIEDMTEGANGVFAGKSYMTNFYLSDIVLNANNKVYTPEYRNGDLNAETYNLISPHGSGLERYNLIVDNFAGINDKNTMRNMMDNLMYTKSYKSTTSPFWYSEFVGGDLTVSSAVNDFAMVVAEAEDRYEHRSRDPQSSHYGTWHTLHSCVYDIANRKLYIKAQENNVEHEAVLDYYYTAREVDEKIDAIAVDIVAGTNIEVNKQGSVVIINNTYDDSTILQNIETLTSAVEEHDQAIQNIDNDILELQGDVEDLGTAVDNLDIDKQDKTDNNLNTDDKTIVGAINETLGNIPKALSDLIDDSMHRVVTDIEKNIWNTKQKAMQYVTMPDTSSVGDNDIIQYIGDEGDYHTGSFYKKIVGNIPVSNDVVLGEVTRSTAYATTGYFDIEVVVTKTADNTLMTCTKINGADHYEIGISFGKQVAPVTTYKVVVTEENGLIVLPLWEVIARYRQENTTVNRYWVVAIDSNGEQISNFQKASIGDPVGAPLYLEPPTNIIWNNKTATWVAGSNNLAYMIELYKDGNKINTYLTTDTLYNFSDITAPGHYTFKVFPRGHGGTNNSQTYLLTNAVLSDTLIVNSSYDRVVVDDLSTKQDKLPIGTVILFAGTTAPDGYLICNGAVYNIVDYSQLANFFKTQFGTINHFGGDGVTTFGVPNLSGAILSCIKY